MSDTGRQAAADRLRAAHDEGRSLLRVPWINWLLAVAVDVTVWTLEGGGGTYFRPMWLAVPGVVLAGGSAAVATVRAHRAPVHG